MIFRNLLIKSHAFLIMTMITISLPVSQTASSQTDYSLADQIPHDAVFFMGSHSEPTNIPAYPNFNEGFQNLLNSMNDFLEWRMVTIFLEDAAQQSDFQDFDYSQLRGDRWAFAVYGVGETGLSLPTITYLSDVDNPEAVEQFIASQLETLQTIARNEELPIIYDVDQVDTVSVYSLFGPGMIPGLGISAAVSNDRLIISTNQSEVKNFIQLEGSIENNLTENTLYQQILNQLPEQHHVTVYNNFMGPIGFVEDLLNMVTVTDKDQPLIDKEQLPDSVKENEELDQALEEINKQSKQLFLDPEFVKMVDWFKSIFPLLKMLQGTGVAWDYNEENHETTTAFVKLDTTVLGEDSPFAHFFNHEPVEFEFVNYLPRNTGTYGAMNMIEPADLWQTIKTILEGTPVSEDFFNGLKGLEEQFGMSLEEDLLSWIGEEYGWVRPVMELNAMIPINKGALMVRVKDADKARASLHKIATLLIEKFQIPIVLETETYRDRTITTYTTPIPVIPVVPAWTLDDDIMLISSHVALIREMLDTKDDAQRGIEAKRSFRELSELVTQPANGVSYQDTESENEANREALNRVASMSSLTQDLNNSQAMIPVMLMDRASYLLELLQIYKATAKQTTIDEDGITSIKQVIKEDLTNVPNPNVMLHYKVSLGAEHVVIQVAQQALTDGKTDLAIKLYELLAEFYPNESRFLSTLANLYLQLDQTEKAKQVFEQAISVMPDTEMLIIREKLFDEDNAQQIIDRVTESAEKTKRIESDKALFGVALHKRISDQEETALALFEYVADNYPFSTLTPAAEVEVALAQNNSHEAIISVPTVRNAPIIDGQTNDPAWSNAVQIPLYTSASNTDIANTFEANLKIIRGLSDFHIAIEGKYPEGWNYDEENIVVSVSPSRNYTNVKEYITQVYSDAENKALNQIKKNRIFNDYGLAEQTDKEQIITAIEWPFKRQNNEDNTWTIEMSIPLQDLTHEVDNVKTTWLFNVLHLTTSGEDFVQLTANGQEDSEKPSLFLFANLK